MEFVSASTAVNTVMIEKIPIVIPSKEREVRSLLAVIELKANAKLSLSSLIVMTIFFASFFILKTEPRYTSLTKL